jgi:hypothetical protein
MSNFKHLDYRTIELADIEASFAGGAGSWLLAVPDLKKPD